MAVHRKRRSADWRPWSRSSKLAEGLRRRQGLGSDRVRASFGNGMGGTHTVCVTDDGFEFQGKAYRSLTKIAFDITGAQWSGPRFFGLAKTSPTGTATLDSVLNSAPTIPEDANG